jgi:hypothetical protein
MNKQISRLFIVAVICFVIGVLFGIVAMTLHRTRVVIPEQRQRETEAYTFFYRTMIELSEGTYNPESGFVRQDVLNEYKKYADRLGGMCQVHLGKDSAGNFIGKAFFPSGDIFDVEVFRNNEGLMLSFFFHRNWESVWRETLDWYRISHTNQRQVGPTN